LEGQVLGSAFSILLEFPRTHTRCHTLDLPKEVPSEAKGRNEFSHAEFELQIYGCRGPVRRWFAPGECQKRTDRPSGEVSAIPRSTALNEESHRYKFGLTGEGGTV
jgi:hypothetical protein